ncbi:MAG: hypothetical protein FJ088_01060 [Deltaproteobacteria bacterium]|nr:hypothetical protein [Deltaproteobacteria bacterium]
MSENRILIIGAGPLGLGYGGALSLNGNDVSFLVRERQYEKLSAGGVKLQRENSDKEPRVAFPAILRKIDRADYGMIFICTRYEGLKGAVEEVLKIWSSPPPTVVFCPVWSREAVFRNELFSDLSIFAPGIAALMKDDVVMYQHRLSAVGQLGLSRPDTAKRVAKLFSDAGISVKYSSNVIRYLRFYYAAGFPLTSALARKGFRLEELLKDREMLSLAYDGIREGLAAASKMEGGVFAPPRLFVNLFPSGIASWLMSVLPLAKSPFMKEMIETHFRKISFQTETLMNELIRFGEGKGMKCDALRSLM